MRAAPLLSIERRRRGVLRYPGGSCRRLEFDGATCRCAFQFDFGTTGGECVRVPSSPRRRCARCRWSRSRRRRLPVVLSVRSRNHRWPRCVQICPSSPRRRCAVPLASIGRRRLPVSFQFDHGTSGGRDAFEGAVIASTAMMPCRWSRSRRRHPRRLSFQTISEPPVAGDAFEVPVIASTAMCAVPLVSIAAGVIGLQRVFGRDFWRLRRLFNPVIPVSGVSSENAAMPLASSRVIPAAGT